MPDSFLEDFLAAEASELLRLRLTQAVPVAVPAAGTDWTSGPKGNALWEILGVHSVFTTSAAVATRTPIIRLLDQDGAIAARFNPAFTIAASSAGTFEWWSGYGAATSISVLNAMLPAPPIVVLPGWTFRVVTGAIDVADQWSNIYVYMREWTEDVIIREGLEIYNQMNSLLAPLRAQQGG